MPTESDDELRAVFEYDSIAVVGCSSTPGKAAHDVPAYLDEQGYHVIPVNPFADSILGHDTYDSIEAVEEGIDVVEVFRPSEEVPGIVDDVLDRDDVDVVWLQEGITHDEAGRDVEQSGRTFVQDHCMKVEHQRLV
ncbi:MAG: CoA-binding protein [Halodesulfurarchaeum sp.]